MDQLSERARMTTQSETQNTNSQPVNVRLSLQDWFKVTIAIIVVTVGQTWLASRYVAKLEGRIEQTEKKNNDQDTSIQDARTQLQAVKDGINTTMMPMARDIGEIKGKLEMLVDQSKRGN